MRKLREYTCYFCKQNFTSREKDAKFCSFVCSGKNSCYSRNEDPWHTDELEYLERYSEIKTLDMLYKDLQLISNRLKIKTRTKSAITKRLYTVDLRQKTTLDNLSLNQIAESLNLSREVIRRWKNNLGLPVIENTESKKRIYRVRLVKFREWAKHHESLFYGCPKEGLLFLFDDEELADRLSNCRSERREIARQTNKGQKLIRLDTKRLYRTIEEAANDNAYISSNALGQARRKAVENGFSSFVCGNIRWEIPKRA